MFGKSSILDLEPSTVMHADSVFLTSADDRIQKYSSMFGFPWTNPSVNSQWYTAISRKVVRKSVRTIPIGIVCGFECTVLQRNLKEWHGRPRTYVCKY